MKTFGMEKPEQLSARADMPRIRGIIMRFVALLAVAIALLLLVWIR